MSKHSQRKDSAFNRGNKIGTYIAHKNGRINSTRFNQLFGRYWKQGQTLHSVAYGAARKAYVHVLFETVKTDADTALTGGN